MTGEAIDHRAVFRALPGMVTPLTPDPVRTDADEDFLRLGARTREQGGHAAGTALPVHGVEGITQLVPHPPCCTGTAPSAPSSPN